MFAWRTGHQPGARDSSSGWPGLSDLASGAPLKNELGHVTGAVVAFQDIGHLREVDRMKDEFVSIVSHELRTPLTSIRGSVQLVLDDKNSVPDPEHRQLMQIALNNCERLVRIINDILDVAKIESGNIPLQKRPCMVAELVRQAVQVVEGPANGESQGRRAGAGVATGRHGGPRSHRPGARESAVERRQVRAAGFRRQGGGGAERQGRDDQRVGPG